jgi:hypothetical protein
MAKFNPNKSYRIYERTTVGVKTFEIHQPENKPAPGGGGPIEVYEPVTENPGNTVVSRPTETLAKQYAVNKKSEGDGLVQVYDSATDGA